MRNDVQDIEHFPKGINEYVIIIIIIIIVMSALCGETRKTFVEVAWRAD